MSPIRRVSIPGLLLAVILLPATARAQSPVHDEVEVGALVFGYDQGIEPWRGAVIRTRLTRGIRSVWTGEAVAEQRFGEPSFAYQAGHAADFGSWITRFAAGTSSGGFYNARYRFDAQAGRKLFPGKRLILLAGGFHRFGRDGHRDTGLTTEIQWYAAPGVVLQAGLRHQLSNPGNAWSRYHDAALTLGKTGHRTLVLHGAFGNEAYQIIDPLVIYTDFRSAGADVTWREWMGPGGFSVSGSIYQNPYYRRVGVQVTLFVRLNPNRP